MFYLPVMVNNVEKSPAEKDCLDLLQPIQAHLLALTATFNAVLNDREKFGRSTEHFLQRLLDKLYTARKVLQSYSFLKV